jgi:hypothetical protein
MRPDFDEHPRPSQISGTRYPFLFPIERIQVCVSQKDSGGFLQLYIPRGQLMGMHLCFKERGWLC